MTPAAIVVVRPEPGNAATLAAARVMGLDVIACPLFAVAPRPWRCPDPAGFDGLLIASANAVRHAGPELARLHALPVHAVGESTAAAVRAAGLAVATIGHGGISELLPLVPGPARLLRLAGAEHVAVAAPAGLEIETRVVYAVQPLPLPPELAARLRRGAVVLLHSAAAARHLAEACERAAVPRGQIALACLAPRIAAAAGSGWRGLACAERPDDRALLALAGQLCQTGDLGVTDSQSADGG